MRRKSIFVLLSLKRTERPINFRRPASHGRSHAVGTGDTACVTLSQAIARKMFAGHTALAGISRKLETTFF